MQVQYYLVPATDKPFDTRLIEARLQQLPGAFRHPDPRDVSFVIAASKPMARYIEAKLKLDPHTSLLSQGMVTLDPRALTVYQDAPPAILAQMEDFVTWFMRTYPCRVLSEEGEDWTARYAQNPKALFVEEDTWA